MWAPLYWIDGPWPGKLAMAARPRGGDWLEDEIKSWQQAKIHTVLSLLEPAEETSLDLEDEANQAKHQGMRFISLPIPDRQVPSSESELTAILEKIDADLASGKNVVVHCRQGIGRTGLVVACLLVTKGLSPELAVKKITAVRGVTIPETNEQRGWLDHYAILLAGAK